MQLKVTPGDGATRMLFTTARISAALEGGVISTGTCFYFSHGSKDYFVTNKHVVEGAVHISIPGIKGSGYLIPESRGEVT